MKNPRANVMAKDVRTPKYKLRIVPNKRRAKLAKLARREATA